MEEIRVCMDRPHVTQMYDHVDADTLRILPLVSLSILHKLSKLQKKWTFSADGATTEEEKRPSKSVGFMNVCTFNKKPIQ